MHPFLNWLLTCHRDHCCLTKSPRPWGVACQIQWPRDSTFHVLACDACPDFLHRGRKRPDFFLFLERQGRLLIVVLELTRGVVEPDKRDQIEAGLQTLREEYLDPFKRGPRLALEVEAFILHSGGVRNEDVRRLQKPLLFMGKPLIPLVDSCGRRLGNLLAHWPEER
jgi:hypothetical protein